MAENLEASRQRNLDKAQQEQTPPSFPVREDDPKSCGHRSEEPVYLPDEIVLEILNHVSHALEAQKSLYSCCLVSHQWYEASLPLLWAYPKIYGNNYEPLVRTICPSVNLHIKYSYPATLIKVLDLRSLVHHSTKSVTAKILGRTKHNLISFVAPQASFGLSCYSVLSKCLKLECLDLSLVSNSTPLQVLFEKVASLQHLTHLHFPRSSGFGATTIEPHTIIWPPKLAHLHLSGGIDANFLYGVVDFPPSLSHLTIDHCPLAKSHAVKQLLTTISRANVPLTSLAISHMPRLHINSLDLVLGLFPGLEELSVSVDYITPAIFNPAFQDWPLHLDHEPDFTHHNLCSLSLTNSGNPGVDDKFSPIDIILALDEGAFPNLRQIKISKSLGWQSGDTGDETDALVERLQELGEEDWKERRGVFQEMHLEEWKRANFKDWAGVWIIEV